MPVSISNSQVTILMRLYIGRYALIVIQNEVSHPKSEVNSSWEVNLTVNYPPFKFSAEMNSRF